MRAKLAKTESKFHLRVCSLGKTSSYGPYKSKTGVNQGFIIFAPRPPLKLCRRKKDDKYKVWISLVISTIGSTMGGLSLSQAAGFIATTTAAALLSSLSSTSSLLKKSSSTSSSYPLDLETRTAEKSDFHWKLFLKKVLRKFQKFQNILERLIPNSFCRCRICQKYRSLNGILYFQVDRCAWCLSEQLKWISRKENSKSFIFAKYMNLLVLDF